MYELISLAVWRNVIHGHACPYALLCMSVCQYVSVSTNAKLPACVRQEQRNISQPVIFYLSKKVRLKIHSREDLGYKKSQIKKDSR